MSEAIEYESFDIQKQNIIKPADFKWVQVGVVIDPELDFDDIRHVCWYLRIKNKTKLSRQIMERQMNIRKDMEKIFCESKLEESK